MKAPDTGLDAWGDGWDGQPQVRPRPDDPEFVLCSAIDTDVSFEDIEVIGVDSTATATEMSQDGLAVHHLDENGSLTLRLSDGRIYVVSRDGCQRAHEVHVEVINPGARAVVVGCGHTVPTDSDGRASFLTLQESCTIEARRLDEDAMLDGLAVVASAPVTIQPPSDVVLELRADGR